MENENRWLAIAKKSIAYILVAAIASGVTAWLCTPTEGAKLQELRRLIDRCFIGEVDQQAMDDAAASAMVGALGDRWSYYIPAESFENYQAQMENEYTGLGITVMQTDDSKDKGIEIVKIEKNSGAFAAGLQIGDIITAVNETPVVDKTLDEIKALMAGKENSEVHLQLLRDGKALTQSVRYGQFDLTVAEGTMLENGIGLVRINNFDSRCAEETIAATESLRKKGAKALVFDVRNNPGGYKKEMVKVLDYLLPEGVVFRSEDYTGATSEDKSNATCLEMPMAVLVNEESYSAAEFFAAALAEYDWAEVVGTKTCGKGYFQNTYSLSDGSAVGLSVGKYYTPKGISLAETGGLTPDVTVEVDEETAYAIYLGTLPAEEDPQLQKAIQILS